LVVGFLIVTMIYDSDLVGKIWGMPLPPARDGSYRVHGWDTAAQLMEDEREKLEAEGKPAFIIAGDYGMTGEFTFYQPAARMAAPLQIQFVYCVQTDPPSSQFNFWQDYNYHLRHKGDNAIFIIDTGPGKPEPGWLWKWLRHQPIQMS